MSNQLLTVHSSTVKNPKLPDTSCLPNCCYVSDHCMTACNRRRVTHVDVPCHALKHTQGFTGKNRSPLLNIEMCRSCSRQQWTRSVHPGSKQSKPNACNLSPAALVDKVAHHAQAGGALEFNVAELEKMMLHLLPCCSASQAEGVAYAVRVAQEATRLSSFWCGLPSSNCRPHPMPVYCCRHTRL